MIVFDRDGNFLRSWGEGQYPRAHGAAHRCRRHALPDRRRRPHRPQVHDRTARCCSSSASPGKPAPYMSGEPFHRCTHTALSPQGRHLRVRRLRQRPRAQVFARRQAAHVVGRAGHRSRPVQHRAQHLHRRRRLGLRRRPREPPGAGVRRQRQVRGAVEQPAPAVRPLHATADRGSNSIIGELGPGMRVNRAHPDIGPRVTVVDKHGKLSSRGWVARTAPAWTGSSSRRTASRSIRAATSTSAR